MDIFRAEYALNKYTLMMMMTTNPEDIAKEDLAIAKSSVAISSAHHNFDEHDDEDHNHNYDELMMMSMMMLMMSRDLQIELRLASLVIRVIIE